MSTLPENTDVAMVGTGPTVGPDRHLTSAPVVDRTPGRAHDPLDRREPAENTLSKTDVVVGTAIVLAMGALFTKVSSGLSLIVTFLPGLAFTWVTYLWLYVTKTKLPSGAQFFPIFFALLAVQFIHFAEVFTTGVRSQFPLLYGGPAYSSDLFVVFNMVSYCAFTLGCILALAKGVRFLLVPALFFIVYGAIGNAISHTWWGLRQGSYFPGLVSAQVYWIAGPLVLYRLVPGRKFVLAIVVVFSLAMIPLLTIFASPGAMRP